MRRLPIARRDKEKGVAAAAVATTGSTPTIMMCPTTASSVSLSSSGSEHAKREEDSGNSTSPDKRFGKKNTKMGRVRGQGRTVLAPNPFLKYFTDVSLF